MHRLLQGEVGSGKTLVALRAMLAVVDAGGQAAMLAPTEVLAQQHHRSITEMMGELAEGGMLGGAEHGHQGGAAHRLHGCRGPPPGAAGPASPVRRASSSAPTRSSRTRSSSTTSGWSWSTSSTASAWSSATRCARKGKQPPHLLVMTATPIPRTVAMTVFGDLETSVLDQLPAGRSPIASHVVPAADKPHFLARAWERVREEVEAGHQAYVVCPRIGDEDDEREEAAEKKAAEDDGRRSAPRWPSSTSRTSWPGARCQGLRVAVLHGRMHPDDKDAVMRRFAAGEMDVLVATTVIEVGVNVPNATVMVIMDADRFGVSQLHQLRGRVGRGSAPGLCLLVTEMPEASPARPGWPRSPPPSTASSSPASTWNSAARATSSARPSPAPAPRLRMLAVIEDEEVIAEAREEAGGGGRGRPGAGDIPGPAHGPGRPPGQGAGAVPGKGLTGIDPSAGPCRCGAPPGGRDRPRRDPHPPTRRSPRHHLRKSVTHPQKRTHT